MSREAYRHTFNEFGKGPGYLFGYLTEITRAIVMRVIVVIVVANIAASIARGDIDSAKNGVLTYFVIATVSVTLATIGDLIAQGSENNTNKRMSINFYKKLTGKDMSFYRDSYAGYLSSVHTQYVDSSHLLARFIRTDGVRTIISLSVPVIVLATYSLALGLAALSIVAVQLVYVTWATKKASPYRYTAHELYRKKNGLIADDITNIVAYKASGDQKLSLNKVSKVISDTNLAFWQRRKVDAYLDLPRALITVGLLSTGLWIALSVTSDAADSVGLIVLTLTYMFQIQRNVDDLPGYLMRLDDLITKLEPTLDVLGDSNELIKDGATKTNTSLFKGSMAFKDVTFNYKDHKNQKNVLTNFNLTIEAGTQIGVVGLSGAGKSTLANLLLRFDDVTSGQLNINGQDVRDISQTILPQNIAYVPQEPLLFHQSIKHNITYGTGSYSGSDVMKAAKAAHAHEFIKDLPNGYDTFVGERGVKLSGGQKQRIIIARAVLKNAPILLFDEATSALDSESEQIIQKALPKILGKQTAIIIAHRLSTVAGLDRIVVMHDGKIEEQGTHKQLLAKKGRYYRLWQKQTTG